MGVFASSRTHAFGPGRIRTFSRCATFARSSVRFRTLSIVSVGSTSTLVTTPSRIFTCTNIRGGARAPTSAVSGDGCAENAPLQLTATWWFYRS